MKKFFKFLSVLFVLAMLPFALLHVLELYIEGFTALEAVKQDNFHIIYICYAVVCLFITGVDYAINSKTE